MIYQSGYRIPKRDKLGLHATTENICLAIMTGTIAASLEKSGQKITTLEKTRIQIETLKQVINLENQTGIIDDKIFWDWQEKLAEISKSVSGWLKYLKQKEPA